MPPKRQILPPGHHKLPHTPSKMSEVNGEELRTWEVEGTPQGFSTSTSLSDLTVDSNESNKANRSSIPSCNMSYDSPVQYATEGTPAVFSRCESLSSLSCKDDYGGNSPQVRHHSQSPGRLLRPRSQSPRSKDGEDQMEQTQRYMVEGTPAVFSRHSSLSSLENDGEQRAGHSRSRLPRSGSANAASNFSRDSSLSSLSVESFGEDGSPNEQALLQQCINQGMPKSKSDLAEKRGMGRRRRGGSRIPAPPSRSPGRMIPGVPMQRLKLLPQSRSNNNLSQQGPSDEITTPTGEVESRKLHSDSKQSEKGEKVFTEDLCRDVEDLSIGDDITENTEPDSEATTEPIGDLTVEEKLDNNRSQGTSEQTTEGSASTVVKVSSNSSYSRTSHLQQSSSPEEESKKSSSENSNSHPAGKLSDGSPCAGRVMDKSSDGSGGRLMDKSTPSWGSLEGRVSDTSMSESGILAVEAMKVARAVANEAKQLSSDDMSQMSHSMASVSDALLDQVKPPSAMGSLLSLSNSINNSNEENKTRQVVPPRNLECRHTKRLPEMVRRALGDAEMTGLDGATSMASSCHSNVDNIMPPSMLLLDDDMENSMISVASITSEVVEPRESPPSNGDMNTSMPSEALQEIVGPAQHLANVFLQEAQAQSSRTLTLGADEASTYQEVTDLEVDNTLGAPDGAASDEDLPPDVPDLPHDSPIRGTRSPHRLTPRSRRKNGKDRYRTFTRLEEGIDETTYTLETDSDISGSPRIDSSGSPRLTPKQRRQEDSERYRTRTISSGSPPQNTNTSTTEEFHTAPIDDTTFSSPAKSSGNKVSEESPSPPQQNNNRKSFRQRRQDDPSRYQTRTISVPVAEISPNCERDQQPVGKEQDQSPDESSDLVEFQDGAELDLTMEQLEALSQDANIVICTLNENREGMTSESSDLLSEENILDIETLSLISNEDEDQLTEDLQALDDEDFPDPGEDNEKFPVIRRPRILKPGEISARVNHEEEEAGKGIRGRRKGLYSSRPASSIPGRPFQSAVPSSNPTRSWGANKPGIHKAPSSPKLPRATRASTLRQNSGVSRGSSTGTTTSEDGGGRNIGSSPGSSNGSSPRLGLGSRGTGRPIGGRSQSLARTPGMGDTSNKPLHRQNTFTKEDSDTPPSPERGSFSRAMDTRRTISTSSRGTSKSRLRKDIVQPSQQHYHGPISGRYNLSKTGSQDSIPPGGNRMQQTPKASSLTRDIRPPTSKDVAEWQTSPKNSCKTVKKEVTSRIASLWKKVEKAQTGTKTKEPGKDKRMWITPKKDTTNNILSQPPKHLVRSSTFEKLNPGSDAMSPAGAEGGNRTRLGLKLSKLRGRDTRSSPPSEATTPIEGKPQCLVSPTRINLRHRPSTHPSGFQNPPSHYTNGTTEGDETKAKRLSRLGSFFSMEGGEETTQIRSPQSAIVAPFNYQPPSATKNTQQRTPSVTRIPQPSKPLLNNPRDDNGNSAYVPGV